MILLFRVRAKDRGRLKLGKLGFCTVAYMILLVRVRAIDRGR